MENLKHIVYKKFFYCHMISDFHVKVCRPKTDGVSSIKNLLMNPTLRYSAWFMVVMITIGNLMVLMGRFIYRDENRSVSVVIRNLAVSDLIMGCYLGIICVQDYRFRDKFQEISLEWTQSWGCVVAGMLSMISSEVSIFILTFMSVERFLLISDPFGHHRLNTKNVMLCLFIIWSVGISIAILPVILFYSSTKFYGIYNGGTCFPLFIQEKYPSGWQYSAIVFLGINSPLLVVVGTLYTFLLFSIWKTRKQCTGRTFDFFDCEFAVRFFFIVLTDSTCWAPIVTFKFLTFMDFEISSDMYAWLVVLVLPLNAAVNPFLYTFSTPKYRDQIYTTFSKRSFSKKHDSNSNQATGDESHNKIMPLLNNSINGGNISTPLRWLFTRKKS
ncbi:CLUMA_CG004498, isoform A [Clunio marinus]|uniref:CLUMA_CG004498, isoform A n=1 Tax=Clunio marinus TaxID=568069 RepID=A0A1J1HRV0_9DIPT|nr:CLUMA_CG004498, isoform A [Clunio marinus]